MCAAFLTSCVDEEKIIRVKSITLEPTTLTLKVGETATLKADVRPDDATYRSIGWTSSASGVASVPNLTAVS